ncbi:MAG: cation transporter [Acidobacteria bacterium]|nr:cation transporter [Acidobacteriota bacterium]
MPVTADRTGHVAQGLRLEFLTIAYNTVEALVSLAAGVFAGSIALVGFGTDSLIEVASGAALAWRLRADRDHARRERAERVALRIVGGCFLALAVYVAFEAGESLLRREAPERSIPGIAIAAASCIVMPLLARAKRRVAGQIDSAALHADSRQSELCGWLSAILLAGLALHAVLGWWWADPVCALAMVPIIAREGVAALRGRACGCSGGCGSS